MRWMFIWMGCFPDSNFSGMFLRMPSFILFLFRLHLSGGVLFGTIFPTDFSPEKNYLRAVGTRQIYHLSFGTLGMRFSLLAVTTWSWT